MWREPVTGARWRTGGRQGQRCRDHASLAAARIPVGADALGLPLRPALDRREQTATARHATRGALASSLAVFLWLPRRGRRGCRSTRRLIASGELWQWGRRRITSCQRRRISVEGARRGGSSWLLLGPWRRRRARAATSRLERRRGCVHPDGDRKKRRPAGRLIILPSMRDCRTAISTRQRPLCLVRRVAAFDGIPSRYSSAACNHRRSRTSPPPRFRRSDQSLEVKAGSSHHAVAAARTQPCTRGCRVTTGATLRAFVHGLAPSCYTKLHSASTAPEPPLAIRAPEAEEPNAEPVRERERGASESEARGHSRRQVAGRGGRRTLSACIRPATTLSVSAAERAAEMLLRICCFCCVSPLASLLTEASAIGGSVCAPPSTLSAAMRCERSHASYRRCCRHWTSAKLPLPGMKRFPERRIATRRGAGQGSPTRQGPIFGA